MPDGLATCEVLHTSPLHWEGLTAYFLSNMSLHLLRWEDVIAPFYGETEAWRVMQATGERAYRLGYGATLNQKSHPPSTGRSHTKCVSSAASPSDFSKEARTLDFSVKPSHGSSWFWFFFFEHRIELSDKSRLQSVCRWPWTARQGGTLATPRSHELVYNLTPPKLTYW